MAVYGDTVHFDATNLASRQYLWEKAKKSYFDKGIHVFWLDEAEPEYTVYDFDNYRYHIGSNVSSGNIYPVQYARTFYEGQEKAGQKNTSTCYAVPRRARRSMVRWCGRGTLHRHGRRSAASWPPVCIWASLESPSGRPTFAVSMVE